MDFAKKKLLDDHGWWKPIELTFNLILLINKNIAKSAAKICLYIWRQISFQLGFFLLHFGCCFVIKPKPFSFLTYFPYCDTFGIWMLLQQPKWIYSGETFLTRTCLFWWDEHLWVDIWWNHWEWEQRAHKFLPFLCVYLFAVSFELILGKTIGKGSGVKILPIFMSGLHETNPRTLLHLTRVKDKERQIQRTLKT